MAKIVLVCPRNDQPLPRGPKTIELLSERLSPDHISPNPPFVRSPHGTLVGILNPTGTQQIKSGAASLGVLLDPADDWCEPGADAPDGLYALCRVDERSVELLTDMLASRSIWYAQTEDVFIASSSQRAIVALLGSYEPDRCARTWMLASGNLGPRLSWDKRIKLMAGNSRLRLDRASWKISIDTKAVAFEPANLSRDEHIGRLKAALDDTFRHLDVDCSKWLSPLSGGIDSRCILLHLLKYDHRPRCVTWGLESSQRQAGNDAMIARSVAEHFGLEHRYFVTDPADEPLEVVLDRYIKAADGRIDQMEAYMDGFRTWKTFFDEGNVGELRGDEVFGQPPMATPLDVREWCWFSLFADFPNLASAARFGLEEQVFPPEWKRQPGESTTAWCDRVFDQYTMPVGYGAFNEIKGWYLDPVNPLVSRGIVEKIRTLPDAFRVNKNLFIDLVRSISPPIEFARYNAIGHGHGVRKTQQMADLFSRELNAPDARQLLSDELVDLILTGMEVASVAARTHDKQPRQLKSLVPWRLRRWLRATVMKVHLDWNTLAFRAYMTTKMHRILAEDAAAIARTSS